MFLSKEQILAAQDRRTAEVDVPEWGGKVRVMELSALERDHWHAETEAAEKDGKGWNQRAVLIALRSIVDEKGAPLFSLADLEALASKCTSALERVVRVAMNINGMGTEGGETAKGN